MNTKDYFPHRDGDPSPLCATIGRRVRFEEADPLGIAWHGRYAGYFEEAREVLCETYGFSYLKFRDNASAAPIKRLFVDYIRPLRYGQSFNVEARLHWTDSAKMNIDYTLRDENAEILTTGYTVQLFVDVDGVLQMAPPDFYEAIRLDWKAGRLQGE
jgi:acyl-CoA thioester hydrolase